MRFALAEGAGSIAAPVTFAPQSLGFSCFSCVTSKDPRIEWCPMR